MQCTRCAGTGVCVECNGEGKILCLSCSGKGELITPRGTRLPCRSCGGEGAVECDIKCPSCNGTGEITGELQQEVLDKYTVKSAAFTPSAKVVKALLLLNAVIFVLERSSPQVDGLVRTYGYLFADSLASGQWWRLITPMFLHVTIWHLLFNCTFLIAYAPQIEGIYGPWRFLGLYLVSGVVAEFVSWLGLTQLGGHLVAGIGASGALFGVGAAYLVLWWRWRMVPGEFVAPWAMYLIGYIAVCFIGEWLGWGLKIDNWAHLGGLIGGILYAGLSGRPKGH